MYAYDAVYVMDDDHYATELDSFVNTSSLKVANICNEEGTRA